MKYNMISTKGAYTSDNILEKRALIYIINKIKNQNKKIGLCVGAFDLLHPGHVNHFISAKKHCDVLIVGITTDKFIKRNKNKNRPIYNQQLRAFFVSQLKPIDFVFLSDYRTANEVINILKPDFYIKGPDYKNDNRKDIVSERESIKKVGGRIIYTSDEKLSSTKIIAYIQKLKN